MDLACKPPTAWAAPWRAASPEAIMHDERKHLDDLVERDQHDECEGFALITFACAWLPWPSCQVGSADFGLSPSGTTAMRKSTSPSSTATWWEPPRWRRGCTPSA